MSTLRRLLLSLAAVALVLTGTTLPVAALDNTSTVGVSAVAGRGPLVPSRGRNGCSAALFDGDRRLGPAALSTVGETGHQLAGYRRTGDLTTQTFLGKYWDATLYDGAGGWIYPSQDGYALDRSGRPIRSLTVLEPGQRVDRYGSEYGSFLAPFGIPYATRSIPPSNLVGTPAQGCNYSSYRVLKAFTVYSGPIAPWFGQPGNGIQYQLSSTLLAGAPASGFNVGWLVTAGYLERLPS